MTEHIDMAQFVEAKSNELTADDLIGGPRTITVTRVSGGDDERPVAIHYEGDGGKPFRPCKTVRRVLLAVWGRNAADYVGRSLTLYRDDSVTFGGLNVGGIRISHMSHIDKEAMIVVMKSKGKKAPVKIMPLVEKAAQTQAARQTPEQWVEQFKADVADCEDLSALAMLEHRSAKALTKLEADHPALHADAMAEFNARRDALDAGADQESFA